MSPGTCRADLKRLINEKVVASCWLLTSLSGILFHLKEPYDVPVSTVCCARKHEVKLENGTRPSKNLVPTVLSSRMRAIGGRGWIQKYTEAGF